MTDETYLNFPLTVKEDLRAAYVIVRDALIVEIVQGS